MDFEVLLATTRLTALYVPALVIISSQHFSYCGVPVFPVVVSDNPSDTVLGPAESRSKDVSHVLPYQVVGQLRPLNLPAYLERLDAGVILMPTAPIAPIRSEMLSRFPVPTTMPFLIRFCLKGFAWLSSMP